MSNNVILCSLCGSIWVGKLTEIHCHNMGYYAFIGDYQVQWKRTGTCTVWCGKGGVIAIPEHLPVDTSEDTLKMFYTFQ